MKASRGKAWRGRALCSVPVHGLGGEENRFEASGTMWKGKWQRAPGT